MLCLDPSLCTHLKQTAAALILGYSFPELLPPAVCAQAGLRKGCPRAGLWHMTPMASRTTGTRQRRRHSGTVPLRRGSLSQRLGSRGTCRAVRSWLGGLSQRRLQLSLEIVSQGCACSGTLLRGCFSACSVTFMALSLSSLRCGDHCCNEPSTHAHRTIAVQQG
jgi:hypothetical protein